MNAPSYKLREWIEIDNLDWEGLSRNPNAINILEKNLDKIDWFYLSLNPNANKIFEKKLNKINWNKIDLEWLSANPNAIHILEKNLDKIDWTEISKNPNIFIYDYDKMKQRMQDSGLYNELMQIVFHPDRLQKICFTYKITLNELIKIYH